MYSYQVFQKKPKTKQYLLKLVYFCLLFHKLQVAKQQSGIQNTKNLIKNTVKVGHVHCLHSVMPNFAHLQHITSMSIIQLQAGAML